MKRIILTMVAIVLSVFTMVAQEGEGAIIEADTTSYHFGSIKEADGVVNHTFTIKNTGNQPLIVTRVIASCGCTTPKWDKKPIAPGQTGQIQITYNPKGRPGPFAKTISVYSNGKKGSFIFTIRGRVI